MAYNMGGRRFRPVGSGKKRTAPQYGPVGTGCPFVEEAVARLYREQNEEHFWSLMNALNYALDASARQKQGSAPCQRPQGVGGCAGDDGRTGCGGRRAGVAAPAAVVSRFVGSGRSCTSRFV